MNIRMKMLRAYISCFICLVIAFITTDPLWAIAGAIFEVSANVLEEKNDK